jgi:hypothetical protein
MRDRVAELALAAATESGALRLYVLLYELEVLAGRDGVFTCTEVCAHTRSNPRLRAAIEDVCRGEVSARRLGKALSRLAKWNELGVAGLRVACEIRRKDPAGALWSVRRAQSSECSR